MKLKLEMPLLLDFLSAIGAQVGIFLIIFGVFGAAPAAAGTLTIVARSGDAAPDGSGELSSFDEALIHRSREVIFSGDIRDGGFLVKSALFRADASGTLEIIVAEDQPSPDGNGNFGRLTAPWINRSGQVAFDHFLEGTLGGLSDATAYLVGRGGTQPLSIAARAGQPFPGGGGDVFGFTFFPFGVSDAGEVAFIQLSAIDEIQSVWRAGGPSGLIKVVEQGDRNPTNDGILGGGNFLPTNSRIGPSGHAVFHDGVQLDSSEFLTGIFRSPPGGSLQKVARLHDPAPGGDGIYFSFLNIAAPVLGDLAVNARGDVAYAAVLDQTSGGVTDNVGLYLGRESGAVELARKGDPVPDGNGSFLRLAFEGLALSNTGLVLFRATVTGATGGANEGLFLAGPGGVEQVVRLNQPVPGGGTVSALTHHRGINAYGQVAFLAFVDDGGQSEEALFFYEESTLTPILREGQTIAGVGTVTGIRPGGTGAGGVACPSQCMINELGEVAVRLGIGGDDHIAIWTPDSFLFSDAFESGDTTGWSSSVP